MNYMQIAATENTIYTSPDASKIFCYTLSIIVTPTGVLIISFDLEGEGVKSIDDQKINIDIIVSFPTSSLQTLPKTIPGKSLLRYRSR